VGEKKTEKEKEKDRSDLISVLAVIGVMTPIAGIIAWEAGGQYVYGTTPAQVAAMSLEGTPKQIGKELARADVRESSVRSKFKVSSARPYDYVELSWSSKAPQAPKSIRLHAEHSHDKDEEHGAEVVAALSRRFHAMHDGQWTWGRFSITAHKDSGEIDADVDPVWNKKPNPLFERQMDAARQVVLEAAFGIPAHDSDAELAELLGTGYKTADVGKIDPQTTIEDAPNLFATRFPGAIHDSSTRWEVAVDHPLIKAVSFYWQNRRGGSMDNVNIEVDESYEASRDSLQACLANVLGPPQIKTTDYAAGKKNYVFGAGSLVLTLDRTSMTLSSGGLDGASLSKIFDALAGCHDKTENTAGRGDGRKK